MQSNFNSKFFMVVGRNFCNETVCVLYEKSFGNKQITLLLKKII